MTTAFARALGAAEEAIRAAGVAAEVYRTRIRPISRQTTSAVVLRLAAAEIDQSVGMGAHSLWGVQLEIDCYARATTAVASDDAVDALLEAVVAALMSDQTLGGVIGAMRLAGVSWDFDVDGEQTACATVTFIVQQFTPAASLS
jgi:hypothetical protein